MGVALLAGCGGKTAGGEPGKIGNVDHADAAGDVALADAAVDVAVEAPGDCTAGLDAVAAQLTGKFCTTTVAVNVASSALVGWTTTCGNSAHRPTEDEARATFAPFTETYAPAKDYTLVGGSTPSDAYVFYHPPGDFGGLAIVSATRGELLFFGIVDWGGDGPRKVPADWRSPDELRGACGSTPLPRVRYVVTQGAVDEATTAGARAAIESSALVRGIGRVHVAVDTLITRYPRGAGGAEVGRDEFIVTIDSGRLE